MIRVACRVTQDYDTSMASADLPIWAPTPEKMQAAIERLVTAAQPTRIILFGSRARGDADDRSDVDLLVIKPRVENRYEELVALETEPAPVASTALETEPAPAASPAGAGSGGVANKKKNE